MEKKKVQTHWRRKKIQVWDYGGHRKMVSKRKQNQIGGGETDKRICDQMQ